MKTIEMSLQEYQDMRRESEVMLETMKTMADWDQVKLDAEHRESLLDVIASITACARRAIERYEKEAPIVGTR